MATYLFPLKDDLPSHDIATGSWLPLSSMLQARYHSAAGLVGGKVYVSQGFGASALNTTEEYALPRTVYLAVRD